MWEQADLRCSEEGGGGGNREKEEAGIDGWKENESASKYKYLNGQR